MLGWHISVYRLTEGSRSHPATTESESGTRLAVWQTGVAGRDWIDELVAAGNAIDLGGNGYPDCYTARAQHLIPRIVSGPPAANAVWGLGPHDIIGAGWAGKTVIDEVTMKDCRTDEWLLVVAFDES